jgi:8-oxo-dGTP pyrophosphatase MutT (NUDIX family)
MLKDAMTRPRPVTRLATLDIRFAPFAWRFARERAGEVAAHFDNRRRLTPSMWNGRILMMRDVMIRDRHLSATCFDTGFADMLAWRDWGWPDVAVWNGFAQGALLGSDGAFVLGVMGDQTANAGKVFFPAGTPDLNDLIDGRLDMTASAFRELTEETGLTAADVVADDGWSLVRDGQRLALFRILRMPVPAHEVARRIDAFLTKEADPELQGVWIARGPNDLVDRMPPFVTTFLRDWWLR